MTNEHSYLDTFETGTTVGELIDELARYERHVRVALWPQTGGGCYLAVRDTEGNFQDILWYDL